MACNSAEWLVQWKVNHVSVTSESTRISTRLRRFPKNHPPTDSHSILDPECSTGEAQNLTAPAKLRPDPVWWTVHMTLRLSIIGQKDYDDHLTFSVHLQPFFHSRNSLSQFKPTYSKCVWSSYPHNCHMYLALHRSFIDQIVTNFFRPWRRGRGCQSSNLKRQ